jgi:hypothetical protein
MYSQSYPADEIIKCGHGGRALQSMPLQCTTMLFCDSSFKISSTFERTKLQYFNVCHAHPHPHSSGFYGKIEQKTTRQDLSILLGQCLKELLCPLG